MRKAQPSNHRATPIPEGGSPLPNDKSKRPARSIPARAQRRYRNSDSTSVLPDFGAGTVLDRRWGHLL
jgi:hypothetical protein